MGLFGRIFKRKKKKDSKQLGTIFLKPSESSKAKEISKKTGAEVKVVGGSTKSPRIISTTITASGRTTTRSGGSSSILRSGSIQKELKKQQEDVRKLEEAKKQAVEEAKKLEEAKKQAEAKKEKERARDIQYAINQARSFKLKKAQEIELEKQIKKLNKEKLQAKNKAELDIIMAKKREKERELRLSKLGITSYNKKITIEIQKSQQEYNSYIDNELKKLQAEVNAGKIDANTANKLLKEKQIKKLREININLNNKISSFEAPTALKKPVYTIKPLKTPKGILEKGIFKLQKIPRPKISEKGIKRGVKEFGIGVGLGVLYSAKGIVDLPKNLATLVKNPSIIKNIPSSIKLQGVEIGKSLKLSPSRQVAKLGTEIFLMNNAGKILQRVTGLRKVNISRKIKDLGVISRIELQIIKGKVPKIKLRIKSVEESLKPIATTKNINNVAKDISKLVPKTVSKSKLTRLTESSKSIINKFLKDKRVIKELIRKYPKKTKFTLREIKTIRSYPKLKTAIKRNIFSKYRIKAVRKVGKKVKKGRRISGVKVRRKEFKSFQEANKEFQSLKRLGKFVKKIEQKGGVGRIESLPKRPINVKELEYFKVLRNIPKQILKDVKEVSTTTFTQKFSARVPVLKRFGTIKKGYWRTIIKDKDFYQNSVSFSLYKKTGKPIGTITFNTLSSKPITRFRSLTNALKWGTNKEVILSKSVGKNFVRSFVLKARQNKVSAREFLSKIKVKSDGDFQDIYIATKKVPSFTTRGNLKKQFKESIPAVATKGRIRKVEQYGVIKLNKKRGYVEILQRGKIIKSIKTKAIINPVIIDTSKIERLVSRLNSLKNKAISQARLKRLNQYKRFINLTKKSKPFVINKKKKVFISESKLKQINKIEKETIVLKESLAARTIPTRMKVTRRLEGIRELNMLKRTEKSIKKLRRDLAKKKALDIATKSSITQILDLQKKFKKDILKKGKIVLTDQKTKQIQRSIQKSIQKSKNKDRLIKLLRLELPILPILPISKVPRKKIKTPIRIISPRILKKMDKKKEDIKFKVFSKPVNIFSVVVKKRGRNIILKDKLIERDALNFVAYELDNQLLRSARLKIMGKSKRARILDNKYNRAFEKIRRKLRQYKIKGKKKITIRGLIEKKRFAIDTQGEKTQLKRSRIKKKKLNKRPYKRKSIKKK